MANFSLQAEAYDVPVQPKQLFPHVVKYAQGLFPTDAAVSCNDTRVAANVIFGEHASGSFIIDIDPVHSDATKTRVSFRASISGDDLTERDRVYIETMMNAIKEGLDAVVSGIVRGFTGNERDLG